MLNIYPDEAKAAQVGCLPGPAYITPVCSVNAGSILGRKHAIGSKHLKITSALSCSLEPHFSSLIVVVLVNPKSTSITRYLSENVPLLPCELSREGITYFPLPFFIKIFSHI